MPECEMTELVGRMEVLEAMAEWAEESDGPYPEKVIRGVLVARMLGESYEVNERLGRLGEESPTVRPGELRWSEPLPGELAALIERQVRLRHAPACFIPTEEDGVEEEETVFVLPRWLNGNPEDEGWASELFAPIPRNLHVRFRGDAFQVIDALTEAELDRDELRAIRLVRKAPDASRRQSMRIPVETDHPFQSKPITDSIPSRSPIPVDADH